MTSSEHPISVPLPIRTFLDAHEAGDAQAAIDCFSPDAVVTDQGQTFRGTDAILRFVRDAGSGSEYTYTSEETGTERPDHDHWVVAIRLVGDFPGGVADVRYRFTVGDDAITELHIG
ncbi:nuclear transport factor 2 family protein [Aeromicrobium sp. CFBP 8757]|uniref:nuclear transport factor 2 family protein n=1 Tax=Aeromicrobium sp. CFBP 8757 TaxID=2775288 RepID=UPI00178065E3|nr:nuclear transport factor 2 family protein [Aeromicrobium sp. CFBP 8757]MBD8606338.1 nuclear transport factor 2 family protein [Aeromicrobium sp. CFBP 8757]